MAITKSQLRSVWAVSICMAVAFIVLAKIIFGATVYASENATVQLPTVNHAASTNVIPYPVMLSIPHLDIKANIQDVGSTKAGAIGTPSSFSDVGWYAFGTIPGYPGNAVIDGHVDDGLGLAGVFKNLDSIKVGDDVYITTAINKTLHFKVTDVSWYDYENVPSSIIFGTGGIDKKLKLITCGGTWVRANKTYDKRLIVTADLQDK